MSELPRLLGLRQLIAIVIGTVIGSGIFIVPGGVMRQTGGSVRISLLVWVVGGVLSLLGALTYGELGAMKPEAGGLYVYLRDAFGPLPGLPLRLDLLLRHRAPARRHARGRVHRPTSSSSSRSDPTGQKLAAVACSRDRRRDQRAQHSRQRRRAELEHRDQGRRHLLS